MIDILERSKPNRPKIDYNSSKKILCIIEGDLEFRYISKIFQLYGYNQGCYKLSQNLIKIAWGIPLNKNINIVNSRCNFQGGSRKNAKVPFPAIQAFKLFNRDLTIFDSIIVFFDGDKDKNREVENYFIKEFQNLEIENSLLVSMPCFESSLIDFCSCGNCRESIQNIEDGKYPCDKYKNNFSKLDCFNGSKHLIVNLKDFIDNLTNSKLIQVNNIIDKFYNNQKEKSGTN